MWKQTDNGRDITIVHLSIRLRCTKNIHTVYLFYLNLPLSDSRTSSSSTVSTNCTADVGSASQRISMNINLRQFIDKLESTFNRNCTNYQGHAFVIFLHILTKCCILQWCGKQILMVREAKVSSKQDVFVKQWCPRWQQCPKWLFLE